MPGGHKTKELDNFASGPCAEESLEKEKKTRHAQKLWALRAERQKFMLMAHVRLRILKVPGVPLAPSWGVLGRCAASWARPGGHLRQPGHTRWLPRRPSEAAFRPFSRPSGA
eukprot:6441094-Pyramimonas_sp.AAC.1